MRGSVRPIRRDGRLVWEARWDITPGPDGQRRQRSKSFDTKREAERHLRKAIAAVEGGHTETPKDLSVGDVLTAWLTQEARHRVRATTYYVYRNIVNNHLIPGIGSTPLAKLTPAALQAWYSRLMDERDSVSMVAHCHKCLRQALKMAQRQGIIDKIPTERVALPRNRPSEHVAWTPDETQRFMDAARSSRYYIAYVLLAATGLRRGELLGLDWADVDLQRGLVHIRQAYTMAGSKPRLGPTKTPESRRHVSLPATMVLLLKAHRERQEAEAATLANKWQGSPSVVTTGFGSRVNPGTLTDDLKRVIARAEVPHSSIHDFRHLHISTLLAHGASLPEVQRRVGHKHPDITLRVYSHLVGEDRTADVIEGALFGE